jgi:hypothetical protein
MIFILNETHDGHLPTARHSSAMPPTRLQNMNSFKKSTSSGTGAFFAFQIPARWR